MSRRIEVELTSARDDGSFTWRAAGAKQPKGVVEGSLLPGGAKVGDVLRAEADFDLEGVTLTAIVPAQEKHRNEKERIELLGPQRGDEPLVTSTLASRGDRDRGPRRDRDRGPRPDRGDRPDRPRREGEGRGPRQGPPRGDGDRRPRQPRAEGEGGDRPPRREGAERGPRPERRPPRPRPEAPAKPKAKRLRPQRTHRNAVLEELPAEHRPIAEQVLQGDIPAVRQAIDKQNQERATKGESPIDGTALLAIAEKLRPRLRTAEWRDRADAALADIEELDLRDLRSVVVAADAAARDEETRALAAQLRDGLTARVEHEHNAWLAELQEAVTEGRVVRALRLSSRPPKAGAPLRPELATRLAESAGAALTELVAPDRWAVLLDAVAHSPVRLAVTPASLPKEPGAELLEVVARLGSRIPAIAALFGVEPAAPTRATGPRRPPKPARPGGPDARGPRPEPRRPDAPAPATDAAPAPTEQAAAPAPSDATVAEPAPVPEPAADEAAAPPAPAPEPATAPDEPAPVPEPEPASEHDEPTAVAEPATAHDEPAPAPEPVAPDAPAPVEGELADQPAADPASEVGAADVSPAEAPPATDEGDAGA